MSMEQLKVKIAQARSGMSLYLTTAVADRLSGMGFARLCEPSQNSSQYRFKKTQTGGYTIGARVDRDIRRCHFANKIHGPLHGTMEVAAWVEGDELVVMKPMGELAPPIHRNRANSPFEAPKAIGEVTLQLRTEPVMVSVGQLALLQVGGKDFLFNVPPEDLLGVAMEWTTKGYAVVG